MKKELIPYEHEEQVAFFEWAQWFLSDDLLGLLWATPNGQERNKIVAKRLKDEGVRPGVPDITFAFPCRGYHGLYIEMKRKKSYSVSSTQKRKIEALRDVGYRVEVCRGFDEARAVMYNYLGTIKGRQK